MCSCKETYITMCEERIALLLHYYSSTYECILQNFFTRDLKCKKGISSYLISKAQPFSHYWNIPSIVGLLKSPPFI